MPVAAGPPEASTTSVCSPWATVDDLIAPCDEVLAEPAEMAFALGLASDVLFHLTGQRWPGVCVDTIRPCGAPCGRWDVHGGCRCGTTREVALPRLPVREILGVLVDGVLVSADAYRLADRRSLLALRRADGSMQRWPTCQDMSRLAGEEHTFEVTYEWGALPPVGGVRAAAILACELYRSFTGDSACRLPERVTSITRQGVSMAILDPLTLFADGRTGLRDVDAWIEAERLGVKRRSARLIDPLTRPRERRGW